MKYRKMGGLVAGFALSTTLLFSTPPRACANDDERAECRSRVEKAQEHYRHELREHGKHSAKADEARGKLKEEFEKCWAHDQAWYDPDRQEWRTDRDWDHHYDWDRDRDRYDH